MPENLNFLTKLMIHNKKKLKLCCVIFSSLWENMTDYIYVVYLYVLIL